MLWYKKLLVYRQKPVPEDAVVMPNANAVLNRAVIIVHPQN